MGNNDRKLLTRPKLLLFYLILTAGIATGLAIFTSASTVTALFRQATEGLFLPILLSFIVAFMVEPLVATVERREIGRTASIFVVYFFCTSALLLLVALVAPHWQAMWQSLQADLPRYTARAVEYLKELQGSLEDRFPLLINYDIATKTRTWIEQFLGEVLIQTPKSALRIGSLLVLVPLFSFFFLKDGNRIMRGFIGLTPNRYFEMAHGLYYHVSKQLAHFIRGRIIEAIIIGLVVGVGLSFTDIRYAPILGAFAGIANLVPYVGPIVGMVPGILIALVDLGVGGQFWWIVIVYLVIAQVIVDNFILIPILISRVANLHPLTVILAVIMGGKLYGVLGMIIGVPVASIVKIAVLEIRQYRRTFPFAQR